MGQIIRNSHGPEWYIQKDLIEFLESRKWLVERTHGNLYQEGFPDLYIACPQWGQRWIDCKNPERYSFTKAQRRKWPLWEQNGIGIWILVAASQEEYDKLFQPPNWRTYWKDSYGDIPDVDALLDELNENA